jgi:hypothetical protein
MKNKVWIPSCFAALFFLSLGWAACSKSKSTAGNTANTPMALVTQATWKYDTSGIDLNNDGIVDVADTTVTPCEKMYTYTFNLDSTGLLNEAFPCNTGNPQTVPFTWSLTNNQTVLTASINPILAGGVNIFRLTSTSLVVYKDSTFSGLSFRYLISLKH